MPAFDPIDDPDAVPPPEVTPPAEDDFDLDGILGDLEEAEASADSEAPAEADDAAEESGEEKK